ncbi:hypothetical protein HJG60_008435 [Phyllostomus discolor]|uniref:Uncharacterized protein n=1 Tax=Phyllostomus discolor TaxID=89673 RepID=A0A833Z756_9CHIR|nr:hypothetical protein HJG60_008435 [Phyllostomus discolor]
MRGDGAVSRGLSPVPPLTTGPLGWSTLNPETPSVSGPTFCPDPSPRAQSSPAQGNPVCKARRTDIGRGRRGSQMPPHHTHLSSPRSQPRAWSEPPRVLVTLLAWGGWSVPLPGGQRSSESREFQGPRASAPPLGLSPVVPVVPRLWPQGLGSRCRLSPRIDADTEGDLDPPQEVGPALGAPQVRVGSCAARLVSCLPPAPPTAPARSTHVSGDCPPRPGSPLASATRRAPRSRHRPAQGGGFAFVPVKTVHTQAIRTRAACRDAPERVILV